jgi:uncharacterized protein YukE
MTRIGGALPELTNLHRTFNQQAGTVTELTNAIRGALSSTWWEGPAADRFREAWHSEFEPMLGRLGEQLTQAGTEVARRRDALEAAGS